MAAYASHTTNKNTHILTAQKNKQTRNPEKQEPHKTVYLSENGGLWKQKSGEWAKSRKGEDRKSNRTRQKNKRGYIEKWVQTDSSEIPDREETSEVPGLPSGVAKKQIHVTRPDKRVTKCHFGHSEVLTRTDSVQRMSFNLT